MNLVNEGVLPPDEIDDRDERREAAESRACDTNMSREEVGGGYTPDGWRVYVIEDEVLGFFAGFTNKGAPCDVPMFCAALSGARKFDAFRDLSARGRALAIRDFYDPKGKVWAYKRHEIFPGQYRRTDNG